MLNKLFSTPRTQPVQLSSRRVETTYRFVGSLFEKTKIDGIIEGRTVTAENGIATEPRQNLKRYTFHMFKSDPHRWFPGNS